MVINGIDIDKEEEFEEYKTENYEHFDNEVFDEEICQIWGSHLEQHHEDYNIELLEIMLKFEKAFRNQEDDFNECKYNNR